VLQWHRGDDVAARDQLFPLGPYFGYWNASIRVVISVWPLGWKIAFLIAENSERFLMRWAAQSAWISVPGMPQSFSV